MDTKPSVWKQEEEENRRVGHHSFPPVVESLSGLGQQVILTADKS